MKFMDIVKGIAFITSAMSLISCAKPLPELPAYTDPITSLPALHEPEALADAAFITQANNTQVLTFVANDLVEGLSFIPQIAPNLTSIQTPVKNTDFDNLVTDSLRNKGYSIDDRFDRNGSEQLATSYLQKLRENNTFELTGIISVNNVLLKRVYAIQADRIEPITTYLVRGVNPEFVVANNIIDFL